MTQLVDFPTLASTPRPVLAVTAAPDSPPAQRPLYVLGGQQQSPRSMLDHDPQWYHYRQGVLLRAEPATGNVVRRLEYISPPAVRGENAPVLFKSGAMQNGKLYLCTQTEVMVWSLPELQQLVHLSLPCFNDLHHVRPTPDGNLLVAISGLDLVVELNEAGDVLREWDVYDGRPWTRFSPEVDYRPLSTKPHASHPNHLFWVDDEIWVTRFEQKDAICLNRPERRIQIGIERVHDGFLHAGRLYFTTVNGCVVIANPVTLRVEEVIDLTACHPADILLGWCRGIWVEGPYAWVGFTRIRPTKFREAVSWVRTGFRQSCPTHIACYDLVEKRCLAEMELESGQLNAVFSIFPA
jgi:hypothetical protein